MRACQSLGLSPRHFQHPCRQGKRASPLFLPFLRRRFFAGQGSRIPDRRTRGPQPASQPRSLREKEREGRGGEDPAPEPFPPSPARRRGHQKGHPSVGRKSRPELPAVHVEVDLPPDGKVCPGCSLPFVAFPGEETKETIEIDVRAYRRLYHCKRYRKTCSCPGTPRIVTAPAPASLIPKGLLGISVFVEILVGKYSFHTPLGRILAFWEQSGLVLSPGTVDSALVPGSPVFTFPFTRRFSHAPGRPPSPTRTRRDFRFSRRSRGKRATDGGSGAF